MTVGTDTSDRQVAGLLLRLPGVHCKGLKSILPMNTLSPTPNAGDAPAVRLPLRPLLRVPSLIAARIPHSVQVYPVLDTSIQTTKSFPFRLLEKENPPVEVGPVRAVQGDLLPGVGIETEEAANCEVPKHQLKL